MKQNQVPDDVYVKKKKKEVLYLLINVHAVQPSTANNDKNEHCAGQKPCFTEFDNGFPAEEVKFSRARIQQCVKVFVVCKL